MCHSALKFTICARLAAGLRPDPQGELSTLLPNHFYAMKSL